MNRLCWQPPFRPAREEQLLTAMLQVHLGEGRFPGDALSSPHWPGFAPGQFGPINAISPRYNGWVLPQLLQAAGKPRLLWIHGDVDPIVCDASPSDPGTQGKLGFREGWPGPHVFPPQPLLQQVQFAVDQYHRRGGSTQQIVLPDVGHTPYLEQAVPFQSALIDHLNARSE
jgi:pimeloyl-ACP methyl ester carboxylesterase